MIPVMMRFWMPQAIQGGGDWGYYGAIMSACATTKTDIPVSRFNKDGSGTDEQTKYYGSTDLANLVYGFSNGSGSTDYDFTSSTYDRTVPFSRNGSEFIESEAYENDYSADVASHVWQLLDASDNNIFKFECVGRTSGYGVDCYYTSGGGSRTAVAATGSYPALWHVFTFTDTQVTGTDNYGGSNHIDTFSVAADIASATQLKVSGGRAYMSTSGLYLNTYSRVSYFPEGYPV